MRKLHEWWDETWNPITGCTRVSAGCAHCYAHGMHHRFGEVTHGKRVASSDEGTNYYVPIPFGELQFHEDRLSQPMSWRNPRVVFVGSMTDMFHEQAKKEWLDDVLDYMEDRHTFVMLTKRPENIDEKLYGWCDERPARHLGGGDYLPNLYIGVSVEDHATADARLPALLDAWYGPKLVSYEPALGSLDLTPWLPKLDGVLAGAETGPKARPAELDWFRSVRNQCAKANVPFFLKQINARRQRVLDSETYDALPWR